MRHHNAKSILAVFLFSCGLWCGMLSGTASAQDALDPQIAAFEGQRIANVVFSPAAQPLEDRQINELLPFRRGDAYHSDSIRTAIERLYASGRYTNIQVDVSPAADGVVVRFVTSNSWFIGNVSASEDIDDPPASGQIVDASRLELGAPFDEDALSTAVQNIRKLLAQNGYFDAVVTPNLDYDDTYQQVNITFGIATGKRARYDTPQLSGDTSVLSPGAVVKATDWHRFLLPGFRGITATRTRRGIEKIRLKYENANRLLATVSLVSIDQDGDKGTPKIEISPGPAVSITAPSAGISARQLRESVPIFEEHTVDPDLLAEGTSNLRDYFQARGYFDVDIQYREREISKDSISIVYQVELGARHRLVHIGISGNRYFDTHTLRERMFLAPSAYDLRNGRFSEAYVRRDIDTIRGLYEANGFRDVQVTAHSADNYQGRSGDLAEFFTIKEGPQYLVSSLVVKGQEHLDLTRTLRDLNSQTGQVFSEFNVAVDRETIIQEYGRNGYPDATFEWNSRPGPRPHTVDLEFVISEGKPQFVRQVVISGLHRTQSSLVAKQVELKPDQPLSTEAMSDTQRKLYDLGIFSAVNMAVQNPDGNESSKYVLYDIDEARRYSLTAAGGLQFARIGGSNAVTDLSDPGGAPGVTPRLSVAISRLNLFGRAQTLTLSGVLSTLQKRVVLSYAVPHIFNQPNLDATFSVLYDNTYDVRTFQSKRSEATFRVAQHVSKPITIFYNFSYRDVQASNLKIDPLLVPLLAQSVRVGIAEVNFIQDRRDDPLDPHKGIYNTLDVGLASKVFGSQTSFVRILGRNATYHRIGSKLIFARQTQIGIQPAFNLLPGASASDDGDPIPLPERFYGGGGNTQRGFPQNQAGPRDLLTGFPLGGSALFFNNTELRFPLYGPNINGVLFEDAGNVFSSLGDITFRVDQRNSSDFDYMVHAVGFGVRYKTPLGPIRMDLAYSINPPKYNGFSGDYAQLVQCSITNTCQAAPQQISHFQFFFSIGQAF